ncbi:hypothetical protein ACQJBY_061071 [Aegilops geniculata]
MPPCACTATTELQLQLTPAARQIRAGLAIPRAHPRPRLTSHHTPANHPRPSRHAPAPQCRPPRAHPRRRTHPRRPDPRHSRIQNRRRAKAHQRCPEAMASATARIRVRAPPRRPELAHARP